MVGFGIRIVLRRLPKYFTGFAKSGISVIYDGVIDFCDCDSASSGVSVSAHPPCPMTKFMANLL